AQNYPWCAIYSGGTGGGGTNCGFTTFEQCMETARGLGSLCQPNTQYVPPPGPHPLTRAPRRYPPTGSFAIFAAIRLASSHFPRPRLFFRWLSPFPFAGVPIVAGGAALDHFVPPLIARHDEGSEVAAAEKERAERDHNEDRQEQLAHGSSSSENR